MKGRIKLIIKALQEYLGQHTDHDCWCEVKK